MVKSTSNRTANAPQKAEKTLERALSRISGDRFREWYQERQYRRNIENGQPYFNGPATVSPSERHNPSQLLQCHRKVIYRQLNAPAEQEEPAGIFWIGSRFEEEIALPFLREAVAGSAEYVTNSVWVDFEAETPSGTLQIKGETDPVIVDSDSKPLLATEIKTRKSVDDVEAPSEHHRAQIHAYMKGLSEEHDRNITDAVILYGGRTDLNIQSFHITFDPVFWRETVLNWAAQHTSYRVRDDLPPADPEQDWECTFCSFRERCGKGSLEYNNTGVSGFLPSVAEYPKSKVTEYLDAHDRAKLTPTLAYQYAELAAQYPVIDWRCVACDKTFGWDDPEWSGDPSTPPLCPECVDAGTPAPLRVPPPDQQVLQGGETDG